MKLTDSIRAAITAAGGTPKSSSLRGLLRQLVTLYGGTPKGRKLTSLLAAAIVASGGTASAHTVRGLLGQLVTARGGQVDGKETMRELGQELSGGALLQAGDTLSILGCSVEEYPSWNGYVPGMLSALNHRLRLLPSGMLAMFGDRSKDWVLRLPWLAATKASAYLIGDQVNSISASQGVADPAQRAMDDDDATIAALASLPTTKVIFLINSRLNTYMDPPTYADQYGYWQAINAHRASKHLTKVGNATIIYLNAPYDIRASGTEADCTPGADLIHDNVKGAFFKRGKDLANLINQYVGSGRVLPVPGTAPAGNLTANPLLSGTGGPAISGAVGGTGQVATGYSIVNAVVGSTCVASKNAEDRQRIVLSGTASSGNCRLRLSQNLTRGKYYQVYVRYQLTGADGVSASSLLNSFSIVGGAGSGGAMGILSAANGEVPSPRRAGANPINPRTGVADTDIGEAWLVTRPDAVAVTGATNIDVVFEPRPGALDFMIEFTDFYIVEVADPTAVPVYMGGIYARNNENSTITRKRFFNRAGLYSLTNLSGFANIVQDSTTFELSVTQANANTNWYIQPGHFSGAPTSYDGDISISTDGGSTWAAPIVASVAGVNWIWAASGLVTGNKVRIRITATNGSGSATATEVITIT